MHFTSLNIHVTSLHSDTQSAFLHWFKKPNAVYTLIVEETPAVIQEMFNLMDHGSNSSFCPPGANV